MIRPASLAFAAAVGIAAILFAVFSLPEPPQSHGDTHPKFASMEYGGPATAVTGSVC